MHSISLIPLQQGLRQQLCAANDAGEYAAVCISLIPLQQGLRQIDTCKKF